MQRRVYLGPCELPTKREWQAMQAADRMAEECKRSFVVVDNGVKISVLPAAQAQTSGDIIYQT